jgi:hypothetical protein
MRIGQGAKVGEIIGNKLTSPEVKKMISISNRRLAQLVDREDEIRHFFSMLDDPDWARPVMFISGEGGMGKSSLLFRMIHECSVRGLRKAEVFWTDIHNHDYLSIMRKIRDDVGAGQFSDFTTLVNRFFTDRSIRFDVKVEAQGSVAEGASFGPDAHIGKIAGVVFEPGAIVIKDEMHTRPRGDLEITEADRVAQMTDQFIKDLDAAAANSRVVVFFDAVEKATEVTHRWLWGGLFESLDQGRLRNTQFIVSGRNPPAIEDRLRLLVDEERLGPLKQQHINEYLNRLQINLPDTARKLVVDTIWVATRGNPLQIANYAGQLSRMWKNREV